MNKLTKLVLILATALLSSCAHNINSSLHVASYNIRLSAGDKGTENAWDERKDDLIALIRNLDLDAFGLQEVRPDQAALIDAAFPDYAKYGEHRGADRVSDEASSIYFRKERFECLKGGTFWLSETPDVPGLKGWGAACPRVCSWALLKDRRTGKIFCFANTHTDHISALARKEGMLLIIRRMKEFAPEGTPIVFTGDHNCMENDEPAQAVAGILKNALYITETPAKGSWRTFNGWIWCDKEIGATDALKKSMAERNSDAFIETCNGTRIDYIYVSPGVRVLDYETVCAPRPGKKLYHSDHFPITARILLP